MNFHFYRAVNIELNVIAVTTQFFCLNKRRELFGDGKSAIFENNQRTKANEFGRDESAILKSFVPSIVPECDFGFWELM